MEYDTTRYQNAKQRIFCKNLLANPKNKDRPRAISIVAKIMAQVRISEANMAHSPLLTVPA